MSRVLISRMVLIPILLVVLCSPLPQPARRLLPPRRSSGLLLALLTRRNKKQVPRLHHEEVEDVAVRSSYIRARSGQGRGPRIDRNHTHHLQHTMLLQKRVQISPNERSILLAISAFQSGQCASISAVAKAYNVPKTTLIRRIRVETAREDYTPTNKKLSCTEEEVLVTALLNLDAQGLSPTFSLVKRNGKHNLQSKR